MPRVKLVLLPGLDGTGVLFQPLLQALPPDIEPLVVAYPDRECLGYDELLPRVLSVLPHDEPFVLLGESYGGPLALQVAATRPQGLRGVILSASFVTVPYRFVPGWAAHLVAALPFRSFPLYARIKRWLGAYATPEFAMLSAQALSRPSAEVFAHRVREIVRLDARSILASLALPVLYLQGTRDHVVPAHNLQAILRIKPQVQTRRFDSPHMLLQTRPMLAAKAIADFIAATANTTI
ncbi:MAG TPA: alpha/beta hydrolase [Rhodocyclaceae bacterium]|nr:alpha/beta hydrolase [Rhodocyclaceae bacterium]